MLEIFLPKVAGLSLGRVLIGDKFLVVFTASLTTLANCPVCLGASNRVHSYYTRQVLDIPWAEAQIQIFIEVRRFYCLNQKCNRQTFAERLGPAIPAYARRTQRMTNQLEALGLALGGEAAARLAKKLGLAASPDTILNLVRKRALPLVDKVRVLGVDEFSFRRGYNYGTILVDLERHEVIELLPDIKKETLIEWLRTHPEIEIISRDRAGAFAEAARLGAPQAVQVADRFHIAQNLWDACEALIKQHYQTIRQALNEQNETVTQKSEVQLETRTASPAAQAFQTPFSQPQPGIAPALPLVREGTHSALAAKPTALSDIVELDRKERKKQATLERRLALYQEVTDLHQRGFSRSEIAQKLGTSRTQVTRYLKGVPIRGGGVQQKSKLDPYKSYLRRRYFEEHFDNVRALWREIQTQGFIGSYSGVATYLVQLKFEQGALELTGKPVTKRVKPLEKTLPSIRRLTWTIFLPPDRLKTKQGDQLKLLLKAHPQLGQGYALIQRFECLIHEGSDKGLSEWLCEVERSEIAPLVSFATGVKRDEKAVRAGLTLKWNQGAVEGAVNRLKLIKRSMFGRANFELLRVRVLAA